MRNTEKPSDVSEYLSRHSNPGHAEYIIGDTSANMRDWHNYLI